MFVAARRHDAVTIRHEQRYDVCYATVGSPRHYVSDVTLLTSLAARARATTPFIPPAAAPAPTAAPLQRYAPPPRSMKRQQQRVQRAVAPVR